MAKGKQRRSGQPTNDATTETPAPASQAAPRRANSWDGQTLRAAREKSGLSVQEISSRTKINIAILKALEEERFEEAPKARVYVRGFVRCMAEEIGIDPEAVAKSYVPRWEAWFDNHVPDLEP